MLKKMNFNIKLKFGQLFFIIIKAKNIYHITIKGKFTLI